MRAASRRHEDEEIDTYSGFLSSLLTCLGRQSFVFQIDAFFLYFRSKLP
jgi:hypothetical protein